MFPAHLTFKVLTDDTEMIVPRSQVMLADDPENNLNLHAPLPNRVSIITMKRKTGNQDDDAKVVLPTIKSLRPPFADDGEIITAHRCDDNQLK